MGMYRVALAQLWVWQRVAKCSATSWVADAVWARQKPQTATKRGVAASDQRDWTGAPENDLSRGHLRQGSSCLHSCWHIWRLRSAQLSAARWALGGPNSPLTPCRTLPTSGAMPVLCPRDPWDPWDLDLARGRPSCEIWSAARAQCSRRSRVARAGEIDREGRWDPTTLHLGRKRQVVLRR